MIDFGPMILNGIEMPFNFDDDAEATQAKKLHQMVSDVIAELDNFGTDLRCDDEVNIYAADPESGIDHNYYSVKLYGGLNGNGIWSNYFKLLSDLMLRLEAMFYDAWIIELNPDCLDDVFSVVIGIYSFNNQLEGETA